MIGGVAAPLDSRLRIAMPWWQLCLYALANVPIIVVALGGTAIDWTALAKAPAAFFDSRLYAPSDVPYLWSPVVALMLVPIVPLGYVGWCAFHVAAIGLIRNPTMVLLVALSGAFWFDLIFGSTMTFVFVAGLLGLRGNKGAGLAYVALCALMPRPVQLPLLVWLLLRNPSWRLPALGVIVIHAAAVMATGYGTEWIQTLISVGPQQASPDINWGPTGVIGPWWLLAGIPLGAWLLSKGYTGIAGLAMSPYLLPHYALVVLWDAALWVLPGRPADA